MWVQEGRHWSHVPRHHDPGQAAPRPSGRQVPEEERRRQSPRRAELQDWLEMQVRGQEDPGQVWVGGTWGWVGPGPGSQELLSSRQEEPTPQNT